MSRVYIAGPMTGLPNFNRQAFYNVESQLLDEGHVVLNPAFLPSGLTQAQYMDICCAMLRAADAVYMLSGWDLSAGARAENALAEKLELKIWYQGRPRDVGTSENCRCISHAYRISDKPGEMPRCAHCGDPMIWEPK
jgi:hypothetical protein